jgi:hypothetical protein
MDESKVIFLKHARCLCKLALQICTNTPAGNNQTAETHVPPHDRLLQVSDRSGVGPQLATRDRRAQDPDREMFWAPIRAAPEHQ